MELIGWYVIVPLALATLVTGVVMALGTRWGLFRHYWVLFSLVLTVFATVVLFLHMPTVSSMADLAQEVEGARLEGLGSDLLHPAIGLVVLLVIQVLNVYKPRGMTRYGQRKQQEAREKQGPAGQPDGRSCRECTDSPPPRAGAAGWTTRPPRGQQSRRHPGPPPLR